MLYPLTPAEIRAERSDAAVDDAGARLDAIEAARKVALEAIRAALIAFAEVVDEKAIRGRADWDAIPGIMEAVDDLIDELDITVRHDLEDVKAYGPGGE